MATVTVYFEKCIQDSQEFGSNDEHMVSRVFFSIDVDGKRFEGLSADVKQSVGGSFEDDPLEVGRPKGYSGPLDWDAFRKCVEQYYRSIIGSSGSGLNLAGGSNIRMSNNVFHTPGKCSFQAQSGSDAWG